MLNFDQGVAIDSDNGLRSILQSRGTRSANHCTLVV